jgi:hypothetical protein
MLRRTRSYDLDLPLTQTDLREVNSKKPQRRTPLKSPTSKSSTLKSSIGSRRNPGPSTRSRRNPEEMARIVNFSVISVFVIGVVYICISSATKGQSIDTSSGGLRVRREPVTVSVQEFEEIDTTSSSGLRVRRAPVPVPRQEFEDQSVFVSADLPLKLRKKKLVREVSLPNPKLRRTAAN